MRLDVVGALAFDTQSHMGLRGEKTQDELGALSVPAPRGELNLVFDNIFADGNVIIDVDVNGEGRVGVAHLVDEDAERPVVYPLVVSLGKDNFGC